MLVCARQIESRWLRNAKGGMSAEHADEVFSPGEQVYYFSSSQKREIRVTVQSYDPETKLYNTDAKKGLARNRLRSESEPPLTEPTSKRRRTGDAIATPIRNEVGACQSSPAKSGTSAGSGNASQVQKAQNQDRINQENSFHFFQRSLVRI